MSGWGSIRIVHDGLALVRDDLAAGFWHRRQSPLVMLFLERIAMFTVPRYLVKWRIAVLGIFIMAMMLTRSIRTA